MAGLAHDVEGAIPGSMSGEARPQRMSAILPCLEARLARARCTNASG